jgi:hypothetical protein
MKLPQTLILFGILVVAVVGSAYAWWQSSQTPTTGESAEEGSIIPPVFYTEPEMAIKAEGRIPQPLYWYVEGDLAYVTDPEVGISFQYPSSWGRLTTEDENGLCQTFTNEEPCNQRIYVFADLKYAGIFLVAETRGHQEAPIGRGGFWGDSAGAITPEYLTSCLWDETCTTIVNKNGVKIGKFSTVYAPYDEPDKTVDDFYIVHSSRSPYYGLMFSVERIKDTNASIGRDFENTVIQSLTVSSAP